VGLPLSMINEALPDIGFAGFFSKDAAIEAAFASHGAFGPYAFWMGVVAAGLTSFYSFRLLFMAFHGPVRASESVMKHVHESPSVMMIPLFVLGAGALLAGGFFASFFVGHHAAEFWRESIFVLPDTHVLHDRHEVPSWVKLSPLVVTIIGLVIAWYYYIRRPDLPPKMAAKKGLLYTFLYNKWYFDELYDFLFVRTARYLGRGLWQTGDVLLIDGLGPNGVAAAAASIARRVAKVQSGYVYHYAFAMLIGVVFLISWYLFTQLG
jgi:NADH-quinone oxidoreductase subunit L